MATIEQINASRRNGARSKGPVTPEGKARVSQNGTKHGIYSKVVVLQNEDHSMYMDSRRAHLAEWAPVTQTEHDLVIDIVDARWRLLRYSTLETAAIDLQIESMRTELDEEYSSIDESTRSVISFAALIGNNRTFEVLQTAIRAQHRIVERAISQLLRLRKTNPFQPEGTDPDTPRTRSGSNKDTSAKSMTVEPEPAQEPTTEPETSEICGTKPEPPVVIAFPHRTTLAIVNRQTTKEPLRHHLTVPQAA